MSEFNLNKFTYQRKPSAFSRDNSNQPCGSASHSQAATENSSENYSSEVASSSSNETSGELDTNRENISLTDSNFTQQLANLMELFPSETRLELVHAITSSSSLEEAVNSVCDKQASSSVDCSNINFECSKKKRKRHRFISEDDEDVEESSKRSRQCDGTNDLKDNCNSTQSSGPAPKDKNEVICLSDDEVGDSDVVVIDSIDNNVVDDDSEDEDFNEEEMVTILSFFNDCSVQELSSVPGLSAKKAEKIIKMRPFDSWDDLVSKLDSTKNLSSQLIDNCQSLLEERKVVENLMNKCENIANKIQDMLNSRLNAEGNDSSNGNRGAVITSQPKILDKSLQLKPYQLTSLNWLVLMHEQGLNGILADEMGLGKTVQAIAFLAHLSETGERGPHLIIVPASTLDNWCRETKKWCPTLDFFLYYGSQDERFQLQCEVLQRKPKPEIVITTYSIATTSDDRSFLRKLNCNYVVLDEGHMLKNMQSQRYQGLMKMKARRRLLLTGTPLQNNLLELMSLLSFVMPSMFGESVQGIKLLFSNSRMNVEPGSNYEKATVAQAKRIMKPFVLRRLKKDVLKQLPAKHDHIIKVDLTEDQRHLYNDSFVNCSKQFKQSDAGSQYNNILMLLRKAANHPLLLRSHYKDDALLEMAKKYCKDPAHRDSEPDLVFEDMTVMSDFELHCLCREEQRLADHCLSKEILLKSGKFVYLDTLLPDLKEKNCRVLMFSQFTMVMDIIEVYLSDRRHRYLRLDGQTSVVDRQGLIDKFNGDPDIFVFLLSTKAGGLGINLTSANVVVLHDVDFNPYNDKQAEDRCHRVGQTRSVTVYRLIAKDTIEEGILQCAQNKLRLERDMAASDDDDVTAPKDVSQLLSEVFNSS
ncbi:SWI/SNF-related matrix-associated actin-dependent regulator of chromatin subfamily A containing DEAD/H box 1-like isoform X2 [Oculina patagonica]